jgi:outer membrane murein-binding lipoprotein Lpp
MRKELIVMFAILALLLLVAGCKPKAPPAGVEVTAANAQELETSINEIPSLEQELNTSELDSLDQELADIDNLDIT